MDAQRGEVFATYYTDPHPGTVPELQSVPSGTVPALVVPDPVSTPIVGTPDVVLSSLPTDRDVIFIGDGATRYRAQILATGRGRYQIDDSTPDLAPLIASIGLARAARGEAGPPHALQPLYVRRPDAELERQRRETR
jgi:tRNA A37 threonylcarbamoyladenosine modification protein TsaB